jgi:hypothetical protein
MGDVPAEKGTAFADKWDRVLHWRDTVLHKFFAPIKEMLRPKNRQRKAPIRPQRGDEPAVDSKILYPTGSPREFQLQLGRQRLGNARTKERIHMAANLLNGVYGERIQTKNPFYIYLIYLATASGLIYIVIG